MKPATYRRYADKAIGQALTEAAGFLSGLDSRWGIALDENYDFSGLPDAVAVYEHGSIYDDTIIIAINHRASQEATEDEFIDGFDTFRDKVELVRYNNRISVFHEMGHGLFEYLADLYRDDDGFAETVNAADLGHVFSEDDEEDVVEDFGRNLADFSDESLRKDPLSEILRIHKKIQ